MPDLLFEKSDGVATLTLNRPDRKNAMSPQMLVLLADAWPEIAADDMLFVSAVVGSNFSNFNMAFTGMFLAQRYIDSDAARPLLKIGLRDELYAKPEQPLRRPIEMGQSLFDFTYAAGMADASINTNDPTI